MNGSALKRAMGCVAFSLALFPWAVAEAHLFHKVFEVPENQLTKDYWVLVQLIEFPNERFDLAAEVYRGEMRVRLKPGGYRKWLKRPIEPGMVYRADFQLKRWTGTLAAEVQRLDHTYGTALRQGIEEGLSTRHAEAVKQAFQQMFFYLIRELSEAIWENLHNPEAPLQLYQFLFRYFSVGLEAFLAINHRIDYLVLRTTIEAVERSLGDPARALPPSPEMYRHHRTRFLRVLAQALRLPPGERERRRDGEKERKRWGVCSLCPSVSPSLRLSFSPSLCPSLSLSLSRSFASTGRGAEDGVYGDEG